MNTVTKKKEGFEGQKAIVMPRKVLAEKCAGNPVISGLYISDIGYYPKARFHYRKRPHGSEQHILIYCIEGGGTAIIKKKEYEVHSGDFIIVPRNIEHSYGADEKNPWTIYWVHFTGTTADAIAVLMQKQFGNKGFAKYTDERVKLFHTIYRQFELGYRDENLVYANLCFNHYLSSFLYPGKFSPPLPHTSPDVTSEAILFMRKKIHALVSLEEMAASVNLSSSHFSYVFKKHTGYSPIEYFNHLKAQKACELLLVTEMKVKEIAFELGIDDPYYFSRFFSKIMGMSPNIYREKRNL